MCGIIGVVGSPDPVSVILAGLESLEYRGYDSAGLAVVEGGEIFRLRAAERARSIEKLRAALEGRPPSGGASIGHTRWATHGAPTEQNAHPHADCSGRIAVVHNGIIENHRELRDALVTAGHTMTSDTDTEVVAHLVESELGAAGSLFGALQAVLGRLRGDFALALVSADEPDVIVAARRSAPLVIGVTKTTALIASDVAALLPETRELYLLQDDELAEIGPGSFRVVALDGAERHPERFVVTWDVQDARKDGYPDFMSKEIREQPRAVAETLLGRVGATGLGEIEELGIERDRLAGIERVVLIGCGSSYHASLVGRHAIERRARVASDADIASEFRYRGAVLSERTLVVAVSQSGETVDTLHALREARGSGATVVALTNVVDSLMAREAHGVLYTHAGPEIGVASTKATLAQIALLEAFALVLARAKGAMAPEDYGRAAAELVLVPGAIAETLGRVEAYEEVARRFSRSENFYFLGRRLGLPSALEGALKLKELAYVRAEGYPAGELKHGPIALIDPSSVVVAVATGRELRDKLHANIEEVRARGATVVAVVADGDEETAALADEILSVPAVDELLSPLVDIVPMQLFAYAIARARGNDVDRPRNLAKVVTVE